VGGDSGAAAGEEAGGGAADANGGVEAGWVPRAAGGTKGLGKAEEENCFIKDSPKAGLWGGNIGLEFGGRKDGGNEACGKEAVNCLISS
jgi:hypothetical protein